MEILDYYTDGGKNLIKDYLSNLPVPERTYGYGIRHKIIKDGLKAFDGLDTRQLRDKLWEIKFFSNRIMYIIAHKDAVHFLHACKKAKRLRVRRRQVKPRSLRLTRRFRARKSAVLCREGL